MKSLKMKSLFVAIMVLAFQVTTFANNTNPTKDDSKLYVSQTDDASFTVRLTNLQNQRTTISLKDENGDILFRKKVKDNAAYASKFNLNQLVSGQYFLHVNRKNKTFIQPIKVTKSGVKVGKLDIIIPPAINIIDNAFVVTQRKSMVENITIYNEKNQSVYTKDFDNHQVSKLSFDTSEMARGKYTIQVKTGQGVYYEDLRVK